MSFPCGKNLIELTIQITCTLFISKLKTHFVAIREFILCQFELNFFKHFIKKCRLDLIITILPKFLYGESANALCIDKVKNEIF